MSAAVPLPAHELRNRHFDALSRDARLLWLGQNTNHLQPHLAVLKAMRAAIDRAAFNAYAPPLGVERLRALILEDLGLSPERFGAIITDEAVAGVPGLALPVTPSHGNFVAIDVAASGIRPEALCFAYGREHIMIRQGGHHTTRFGDRFVKVSTTMPAEWIARFCELLSAMVEAARGINEVPELF